MIEIRKARVKDIPSITRLDKILDDESNEIVKNNYPEYLEDFSFNKPDDKIFMNLIKKAIYSKNSLVLVSEINSLVVGYLFLSIKKNPFYKLKQYGLIQAIFIEKNYRNRKISTKLVIKALAWCKEKKLKRVSLYVLINNHHAIEVYKNWGFVPFSLDMKLNI